MTPKIYGMTFEKVNFCTPVLDALERKVQYMTYYRRNFNNEEMAILSTNSELTGKSITPNSRND